VHFLEVLQKCFSHPSLVISFFSNPSHKITAGIANRWETTNSKPPGRIIMIDQSETWSSSEIIFITLFSSRGVRLCCAYVFVSLSTVAKLLG
jgi:hypothetical protein